MNRSSIFVILFILMVQASLAFSTVGLAKVDFQSNDPQLRGPAWLLTVVENGNGQYAIGTIDNAAITRTDGATAKQDLQIELQNTQNTCQYAFTNNNVPIYTLEYRPASFWSAEDQCKATPGCIMTWRSWSPITDVYNVIRTPSANANPLSTPNTLVSTTIKLTAAGETASSTITNTGARSVKIGSRAYAEWQGNLLSGGQCPSPSDSGVTGIKQGGSFYIVNKAAYDRYDPEQNDLITCFNSINRLVQNAKAEGQKCIDTYNAKTGAVLTRTAIAPFKDATISTDANGTGQALVLLSNNVQFPQISMRVSADWLGIYLPVGQPEIQPVGACTFTEGSQQSVPLTVKNVGDVKASFTIGVSCQNAVAQFGTSNTLSDVMPGGSKTADLMVTGQAKGGTTTAASCTVTATDFNNADKKDTKSFSCTVKPQALCQANLKRCVENKIQNCNNEGSAWVDQETCLNGCTAQDGVPVCQNAEVCSSDAQCDDHDTTTVDQCVGIVSKQCKHVVVPGTPQQPQGAIPFKLLGFGIALVVFALATYFLASNGWVIPAVVTGILTVASLVGVIIGAFSAFSLLSAWLITFGIIALLVGIGLLEFAPEVSLFAFIAAAILIILGIMLFYTCTNPGVFLKTIGVCS